VEPEADGMEPIYADDEGEDPRVEIARLEAQIDKLSELLERCRKIRLFSRIAIAGGAACLAAATLGLVDLGPIGIMAAVSAVIGGIVGFGSNTTTTKETTAAIRDAEARRAALISRLNLRTVGDGRAGHSIPSIPFSR
jgi:hypothetical protein